MDEEIYISYYVDKNNQVVIFPTASDSYENLLKVLPKEDIEKYNKRVIAKLDTRKLWKENHIVNMEIVKYSDSSHPLYKCPTCNDYINLKDNYCSKCGTYLIWEG